MLWRNSLSKTIYSEVYDFPELYRAGYVKARKATNRRLYEVLRSHVSEYTPDPTLEFPTAGEPTEDAADLDTDRSEVTWVNPLGQQIPAPVVDDLPHPVLPSHHGTLRSQSYNVGTALALLSEIQPHWPTTTVVNLLRAAVLHLEDEIQRVQGDAS